MSKNTFVVNLFGGPCCGKSTVASGLFYELKCLGIDCELVTEVSKDEIWNGSTDLLKNQPYIFGNQLNRIWRLNGKVDIVVCDSPILLSIIYSTENSENFNNHIIEEHKKFDSINFLLDRTTKFDQNGRVHNEKESKEIDKKIKKLLSENSINFYDISGLDSKDVVRQCLALVREELLFREDI